MVWIWRGKFSKVRVRGFDDVEVSMWGVFLERGRTSLDSDPTRVSNIEIDRDNICLRSSTGIFLSFYQPTPTFHTSTQTMPRAEIEAFGIDPQLWIRGVWGLVKLNAQQVYVNDIAEVKLSFHFIILVYSCYIKVGDPLRCNIRKKSFDAWHQKRTSPCIKLQPSLK
jgi:hypothetical protein